MIKAPTRLKGDALKEWKRLAPELERDGRLTERTKQMFAVYCETMAAYLAHVATLNRDGWTCTNDKGVTYAHPCANMMSSTWKALLSFSRRFGLDPESIGKMGGAGTDHEPELDDLGL